jgi:very-short-patch-repair endonuclease
MKLFNKKTLLTRRKDLRNNPTDPEKLLWYQLRNSQLDGRKFRRQESIGHYIVDFYCPSEKLVVELDGEGHFDDDQIKYDLARTKYLEVLGLRVIRFKNGEVLFDTDSVVKKIQKCLRTTPSRLKRDTPP